MEMPIEGEEFWAVFKTLCSNILLEILFLVMKCAFGHPPSTNRSHSQDVIKVK